MDKSTLDTGPIIICFACDEIYVPYMGIAILSILKTSSEKDSFVFYILENKISEYSKKEVQSLPVLAEKLYGHKTNALFRWINVNTDIFSNIQIKEKRLTRTIFCRYFIPEYIKEDKVIYLDCDVMARSSLSGLWNINIDGSYVAGALDFHAMKNGKLETLFGGKLDTSLYINSGVLLINNKKWRDDGLSKKMTDLTLANKNILRFPDQDIINYVCQGKKKIIPNSWNLMGYIYKPDLVSDRLSRNDVITQQENCNIRHFQPWRRNRFMPHREEYLGLMSQSPWKNRMPEDDSREIALAKHIVKYLWKHPFCLLKPSFYMQWKLRGTECMFFDW